MTWPPPPPASDPWATGPDPDPDREPAAESPPPEAPADPGCESSETGGADPVPAPAPPEPVFEPRPEERGEPVDPGPHVPVPPVDVDYAPEPEYFPPPQPGPPPPGPPPIGPPPIQPADAGGWSSFGHGLPPVVPRPQAPPPPSKKPLWLAAAAVAGLVVVGLIIWLILPSGSDDASQTAATTTSAPPAADPAAEARLLQIIPAGYPADTCAPIAPPRGARAAASCGPNIDPGGPLSTTYTVTEDGPALDAAFNAVVNGSTRVNCPGNIQSPGPWRRNATPQKVSGVLFCGIQQNRPVVAWTNVDESLVVVAESGAQGPNLDQLYVWWSSHS